MSEKFSTFARPGPFALLPKNFTGWPSPFASPTLPSMYMEFARVLIGLAIALFHAQVADFLREQDQALAISFRQRGVPLPGALPRQAAHNLFFSLGILLALFSLVRIWMTLR